VFKTPELAPRTQGKIRPLRAHWESVVGPLLDALSPRVVVEVGVASGRTTERLVEFAAGRDCAVHAVDPAPAPEFDLERFSELLGERFVFHRERSLDALPRLGDADAVLIDGDHNWYTVHEELTAVAKAAAAEGREFPLTLLHDIDWPYGRRDMYHDPSAIPEGYRQPFRRAGMVPGRSELVEGSGVNRRANNAVRAGPRLSFQDVVGFSGLGIVADRAQVERIPALRERLAEVSSPAWLKTQCERIELRRLETAMRLQDARAELRAARASATAAT
jgi:Methyltransferase domain